MEELIKQVLIFLPLIILIITVLIFLFWERITNLYARILYRLSTKAIIKAFEKLRKEDYEINKEKV